MSDIQAVQGLASTSTLREFAKQASPILSSAGTAGAVDSVEISELATFLNRLAELPEDRARQIVNVRNQIANGTYMTEDKLDFAASRLFEEL